MKPRIYLETSVISYLTARPSNNLIASAQQAVTHAWWATRDRYELYTSQLTIDEAARGDGDAAQERLLILRNMPVLTMSDNVQRLGEYLVEQLAMPTKAIDDAYHVAISAVHGMDYLLTWNCKHIANLQLRERINQTCMAAGYPPALIGTPQEMLDIDDTD